MPDKLRHPWRCGRSINLTSVAKPWDLASCRQSMRLRGRVAPAPADSGRRAGEDVYSEGSPSRARCLSEPTLSGPCAVHNASTTGWTNPVAQD